MCHRVVCACTFIADLHVKIVQVFVVLNLCSSEHKAVSLLLSVCL